METEKQNNKITSFKDLEAWKEGHRLVLMVYKVTKSFPAEEKFALIDQMRRAAISVTSNIAEGFSRQHIKEKIQFYSTAKGSNTELENQILIAKDVNYITSEDFNNMSFQSDKVGRLITGLIKFFNNK